MEHRGWSTPGVIVGVATFVVAFATLLVTFAIGYTGSAGFRAWVDSAVPPLGPWSGRMASLSVSFVASVVAGLLANWLTHRARESNWLERWSQWRRETYASALSRAAGPVREELAARLGDGMVNEHGSVDRVASVGSDALQVLLAALLQYDASTPERVVLVPDDLRFEAGDKGVERSVEALMGGCRELERAGFVESWRDWEGAGIEGVEVMLGERCVPRRVARDISWEIERVLVERGVWAET